MEADSPEIPLGVHVQGQGGTGKGQEDWAGESQAAALRKVRRMPKQHCPSEEAQWPGLAISWGSAGRV